MSPPAVVVEPQLDKAKEMTAACQAAHFKQCD